MRSDKHDTSHPGYRFQPWALCETARQTEEQQFLTVQADVVNSADRGRMLTEVLTHFGRLDCLVNNAGVAPRTRDDIVDASEESFDRVMETNLKGPYFLTQAVARHWLEKKPEPLLSGGFCVIFVTSVSANTASTARGEYCISKAGLSMAAQLWAARLAADGILVYELRPGIMISDMTASVQEKYEKPITEDGLVPQRRWGTAEDVGRAVTSLVDGDFPFSTGTIIDIDGGLQIRQF
jgi:NAD(P)-dependent dehydrogenase (short-subunit alcohol dehydrogenase family)